jgi:hypothetical protein
MPKEKHKANGSIRADSDRQASTISHHLLTLLRFTL